MLIKNKAIPSVVEIEINGEVTEDEMNEFETYIKQKVEEHGKLNALIFIKDLDYTVEGFIEEIKFDIKHLDDFNKVALVSDEKWIELGEKLSTFMPSVDAEHFDPDERQKAMAWLS